MVTVDWGLGGGATDGTCNYCFQPEPNEGEGAERGRSFAVETCLTMENSEAVSPIKALGAAPASPISSIPTLAPNQGLLWESSSEETMP